MEAQRWMTNVVTFREKEKLSWNACETKNGHYDGRRQDA